MSRPVGSRNKKDNQKYCLNQLKKIHGDDFDPVVKMAENAVFMQSIADEFQNGFKILYESKEDAIAQVGQEAFEDIRGKAVESSKEAIAAWRQIAPYTNPQLKQIEVHGEVDTGKHKPMQILLDRIEELAGSGTDGTAEGGVSE